jgi:hypothetical protein
MMGAARRRLRLLGGGLVRRGVHAGFSPLRTDLAAHLVLGTGSADPDADADCTCSGACLATVGLRIREHLLQLRRLRLQRGDVCAWGHGNREGWQGRAQGGGVTQMANHVTRGGGGQRARNRDQGPRDGTTEYGRPTGTRELLLALRTSSDTDMITPCALVTPMSTL